MIKLRRMRLMGYVARMWEWRGVYRVLVGKSKGKDHLEDPGIDGKIILRCILKWNLEAWTGWIRLRIGVGIGDGHL
jgi:hypothetical protein